MAKKTTTKKSSLYLDRSKYSAMVKGLTDQGIDRSEAIETLKIGLRQANGINVESNTTESETPSTSSELDVESD